MKKKNPKVLKKGFCVCAEVLSEGLRPILSSGDGRYIIFEKELEAQREIVDSMMMRLQEFLDGERDFEDATAVDEFVVAVTVRKDGFLVEDLGRVFAPVAD